MTTREPVFEGRLVAFITAENAACSPTNSQRHRRYNQLASGLTLGSVLELENQIAIEYCMGNAMNIWALNKHNTIKHLLIRLEEEFGKDSFHVVSPQGTNEYSVRIAPPDGSMTIYIYCYAQSPGHYGVHFEFPITNEEENYDEISLPRLLEMVSPYLF